MVIGPAGVGKTSFIRRLTGQSFNPDEQSTKGTEENIVTNNAVNSWKIVSDTHKSAEDVLAESIASSKPRTLQEVSKGEETKDFAESTGTFIPKAFIIFIVLFLNTRVIQGTERF
nr:uncharacterized protein LOC129267162 [Lytechinus pictus]